MGPLDLIDHLLNFVAPALFMAVYLTLSARFILRGARSPYGIWKQMAVNLAVGTVVLSAGLVFFGRDGKMMTYAALVLACATSQWLLSRSWRK